METHFSRGAHACLAIAAFVMVFGAGVSASNAEPAPSYLELFRQAEIGLAQQFPHVSLTKMKGRLGNVALGTVPFVANFE